MKKGFTLIELLAVIVILAIIALIATPIILNIISNVKDTAILRSSESYVSAINNAIIEWQLDDKVISDGTYNIMYNGNICLGTYSDNICDGEILEVEVNGVIPTGGLITIKNNKVKSITGLILDLKIVEMDENGNFQIVSTEVATKDWEYVINEDRTITLTKYIGNDTELIVPNLYIDNGNTYRVTKVGNPQVVRVYNPKYTYEAVDKNTIINILGNTSDTTIKKLTISDGVNVGDAAFFGLSSLTTLNLGKIEYIGQRSFDNCYSLTGHLNLKEGLKEVGYQAFLKTKFTEVTLPESLERIEYYTFGGHANGSTIKTVNYNCINLVNDATAFNTSGDIVYSNQFGFNVEQLNISNKVTSIPDYIFIYFEEIEIDTIDFSLYPNLTYIGNMAFANWAKGINRVIIPKGTFVISDSAFSGTTINNYTYTFPTTLSLNWKEIPCGFFQGDSSSQSKNNLKYLTLEEGVEWIGDFAFNHQSNVQTPDGTFTIPASVKQIGGRTYTGDNNVLATHPFHNFGTNAFKEFVVSEGNDSYTTDDGVLYNISKTVLISYPRGKTDLTYTMPNTVTGLSELALSYAKCETLVISDKLFISSEFPDNFNATSDINTLSDGLYVWNKIKNIEVRETNENYKSVNGMLLTKDGSTLIYIPRRNSEGGVITIPDTVTTLMAGSIYGSKYSPGEYTANEIQIPASVIDIPDATIEYINEQRSASKVTGWTITVSPDNQYFTTDSEGLLVKK